jgi:bacillithiol biosynthesis cysteine-adding enzyme BshC
VPIQFHYLPYRDTGYFSSLVNDYLDQKDSLRCFYTFGPDKKGLEEAIKARAGYPVDRNTLTTVLQKQYAHIPAPEAVQRNITLLAQENTFTICTAHQPNLMTGYLYFIYKIVHAIKLAEVLGRQHPDKHFVPVYYMGSEDNDLDELGTFRYEGRKFTWYADGQQGAVGRMRTATLKPLLDELFKLLGPPGENCDTIKDIITHAYLQHETIGAATQYLVNELFGRYGLVVLDPDEAAFKRAYIPVMKDDLLQHTPYSIVSAQSVNLSEEYRVQAYPRQINLFYMTDNLRERIEQKDDKWIVVNSNIQWTETELLNELETHPERFSPNVILRGMFQETIMPNVAFIGGGAEVAYWLQLKTLFDHYKVCFPSIQLRQSVMWLDPQQERLRRQTGFEIGEIFQPETTLVRDYVTMHSEHDWQTSNETAAIQTIMNQLKQKALTLDPTLKGSAEAVMAKMRYQLQVLEKKMLRAEKKKMQVQLLKISRLKEALFPKQGLQERVDNFLSYFLTYGYDFFDLLKEHMQPLNPEFMVAVHSNDESA